MIKNETEYQITKTQRDKFAQALKDILNNQNQEQKIHPLLRKAQEDALKSQLEELSEKVKEYEKSLSLIKS